MKRFDIRGKGYTFADLQRIRDEMAEKVNRRLYDLERAGYKDYAYRVAVANIRRSRGGRRRRYEKKKKYARSELNQLRMELDELQMFLGYKTSSVEGAMEYENKVVNAFEARGIHIDDRQDFWNFLSSSLYNELANKLLPSEILQDFYTKTRAEGYKNQEVRRLLREFRRSSKGVKELYAEAGLPMFKRNT